MAIYGVWVVLVIDGFCSYLGIRCLVIGRINKPSSPGQQDARINAEEQGVSSPATLDSSQYHTF
jgi:ethanolaminephosphotransferase